MEFYKKRRGIIEYKGDWPQNREARPSFTHAIDSRSPLGLFSASLALGYQVFQFQCLKLYEYCAAACQTDAFTVGKGGCRSYCMAIENWFVVMNHYLAQLCPRTALWVIFAQKGAQAMSKGVLFGTYTNPFREQANNSHMGMVCSPVPGLTPWECLTYLRCPARCVINYS